MKAWCDLDVRIGANPILWSNDDFHDLGGEIPLERCLSEMRQAGYDGTELGHKFPREARALGSLLERHDLRLVSGWHSLYLLQRPFDAEARAYEQHLDLLEALGCRVAIVAECSRRVYDDPQLPLQFEARAPLGAAEWERLAAGIERLAERTEARGMHLAYHHHMGTVIQGREEIETLLRRTRAAWLLADTGHLAFAGIEPIDILREHVSRVAHVHLKNVRPDVVRRARTGRYSFARAVREGVFTVPGDGGLDYGPILAQLAASEYAGWLVVEAEQDPLVAPPLEYAARARDYLRQSTGI